ncbi:hypothetical protein DM469_02665 [Lactobacillus helveticus]|uniref:Alpha-galactosidase n=1 Tax=Lactobacillus helveticus TaxID=1587 RepID=A0AAU8XV37_LACHE|nr:hypothetical protein Lh8105_07560 [Lactobacillus helveticus]PXZ16753.1 hypothetical protein DM471_01280 [Lactobacillus helveticus]PXZ23465.1 hypothetical protein DM468_03540 [Lactobacillus helveticus]PXZ26875.1 hypothetical protein DM472_02435 [Lactobacillus helveticus]PXZ30684.1 hypothetical protein DM467_02100 [Lactobacillus helveticus]
MEVETRPISEVKPCKSIRVDTAKPTSSGKDFSERVRSVRSRQLARARATMARYGVKASSGHSGG